MFLRLMGDLRFAIGLFFGVISLILLVVGNGLEETAETALNMNVIVGGYMGIFAMVMLGLALREFRREPSKVSVRQTDASNR